MWCHLRCEWLVFVWLEDWQVLEWGYPRMMISIRMELT